MPFFVMERLRGVVPVQWRGNDPTIFPDGRARRAIGLQFVDIEAQHPRRRLARGRARPPGAAVSDPVASARFWVDHWAGYYEDSVLVELPLHALRDQRAPLERRVLRDADARHGDYRIGNFMLADGNDQRDLRLGAGPRLRPGRGHRLLGLAAVPRPQSAPLAAARPRDVFDRYEELTRAAGRPEAFHSGPCSASSRPPPRTYAARARSRTGGSATCGSPRWGTRCSTCSATSPGTRAGGSGMSGCSTGSGCRPLTAPAGRLRRRASRRPRRGGDQGRAARRSATTCAGWSRSSARVGRELGGRPRQALDRRRPQEPCAASRRCGGSLGRRTRPSRASARASRSGSASATRRSPGRAPPASSTARSRATGRTARFARGGPRPELHRPRRAAFDQRARTTGRPGDPRHPGRRPRWWRLLGMVAEAALLSAARRRGRARANISMTDGAFALLSCTSVCSATGVVPTAARARRSAAPELDVYACRRGEHLTVGLSRRSSPPSCARWCRGRRARRDGARPRGAAGLARSLPDPDARP